MTDDDMSDDQMETRLRRALNTEAAMVQPAGDGLQKIRGEIDVRHRSWWRSPAVALVAAAVLGLAVGGLFFGLRDDKGSGTVATQPKTPTPTAKDTPSTSPSSSPTTTTSADVYVYYVQANPEGPRLYREQHAIKAQVTDGGDIDPAELAVTAMLSQDPKDPDYASPWPANVDLLNYHKDADTVTVDLSEFLKQGAQIETAAVQELVYTVTANDPSAKKVRLLVQGQAPQGHRDWSGPIRRAPLVDVQALIWILAPTQDARVSSPVAIDGYGTAFEGTISWEVREDGVVVKEGHTQGGSNGEFAEFHDTVQLPPGDYELTSFESSAKDGSPIHIDTKNFTVTQ